MSKESTTPDLVQLMRKAYEPVNRRDRDLDAMMSFYAPDALWESPPLGTRFEGRAAIRGFAEDWMSAYEERHAAPEELFDLGSGVVSPWSARAIVQSAPLVTFRCGRGGCSCGWMADSACHGLHRNRRGPCSRRTSRRGTGLRRCRRTRARARSVPRHGRTSGAEVSRARGCHLFHL